MAKNVKVDKKLAKKIAEKKSSAELIRELTDEQKDFYLQVLDSTKEELFKSINELKQELFNLRFQAEVGKLEKTADLRKVKKEIARCYTVLTERANANN